MNPPVIEMTNVRRSFGGVAAVRDLNLTVSPGSIYGFLGRNGAGKTTTVKMLAGLLRPDSGAIRVRGVNPAEFTVEDRWNVGYVSEKQVLPPLVRVDALISFCAGFYPSWDHGTAQRLLGSFDLDPRKRVNALSLGGARKLALLLALAQRPQVLLLDEPAGGLDVVARRELLDELVDVIREGERTVLLSSHVLSDVERVADRIGIMVDGELKVSESLDSLKETVKRVRFYDLGANGEPLYVPGAYRVVSSRGEVAMTLRLEDVTLEEVAAKYHCRYEVSDLNLEDIFVDLAGGRPEGRRAEG